MWSFCIKYKIWTLWLEIAVSFNFIQLVAVSAELFSGVLVINLIDMFGGVGSGAEIDKHVNNEVITSVDRGIGIKVGGDVDEEVGNKVDSVDGISIGKYAKGRVYLRIYDSVYWGVNRGAGAEVFKGVDVGVSM